MNSRIPLLAAAACAAALSGCAAPDGDGSGSRTGAVIGALGGGLAGATAGRGGALRTAVGAAIGAGLGGAVGSALDAQAQALRRDIANPEVAIVNTGAELVVTLPEAITFATGSAVPSIQAQRDLAALAGNLADHPASTVFVTGHTDATGPLAHNMDLSQRRAQSVADVLTGRGVPAARIAATGTGPARPVASNATEEGRRQNRRVEIVIRPD